MHINGNGRYTCRDINNGEFYKHFWDYFWIDYVNKGGIQFCMKIGFRLRIIYIKITNFIRHLRETYYYLRDFIFENSFKKGEIKTLLTIQEGAVGDTYNFVGVLNELTEKYPDLKISCLTRENSKNFYKNPKLNVISLEKAESLIKDKKIDSLISYGDLNNFFKNKKIVFKIPNRSGKLFPYKIRHLVEEVLPMFKKLGFEINNLKFCYTKEAEKISEKFYKENNIQKPVFIHIGSGKTIRALKEGKVPSTMWSPENWARVANHLIEKEHMIIFTGVKEEENLVKDVISKIKNKDKVINIAGRFSIEEVASIGKRGELVIGVDSGMTHILSQIGMPVIILFAGDPKISTPYKNSINLWSGKQKVCNSCRRYSCPENNPICINSINVEDVLGVLEENKKCQKSL